MKVICSVFDSKGSYFFDPFAVRTRAEAARHFMTSVTNPDNGMLYQHPEDFTLFYLGEFDELTGAVERSKAPEPIVNGLVLHPEEENPHSTPTQASLTEVK